MKKSSLLKIYSEGHGNKVYTVFKILGLKLKFRDKKTERLYNNPSTLPKEMYPEYLKNWFKRVTGNTLNLDNPQTFNEKVQWLKLHDSTPIKTKLADKYLVRDFIKEKIGEEYLIPLLGVWDSFDEIDFDKLPNQFVLKCNHGSAYNIIVTDKNSLDLQDVRNKINAWMAQDYSLKCGLELHYSAIPRKIIAEKYLETQNNNLQDYKFLCFDGEVKYVWVDSDRFTEHKRNIYDLDWNLQDKKIDPKYDNFSPCPKPVNFDKMLEFAKILSKNFALVRVDFYEHEEKLYFGEMTFTSSSGTEKIVPDEFDKELAGYINLDMVKNK